MWYEQWERKTKYVLLTQRPSTNPCLCLLLPVCHCPVLHNSYYQGLIFFLIFTFQSKTLKLLPLGSTVPFFLASSLKRSCQYILGSWLFHQHLPSRRILGCCNFFCSPIKFMLLLIPFRKLYSTIHYTKSSFLYNGFYIFFYPLQSSSHFS